jgi:hypothetical protein
VGEGIARQFLLFESVEILLEPLLSIHCLSEHIGIRGDPKDRRNLVTIVDLDVLKSVRLALEVHLVAASPSILGLKLTRDPSVPIKQELLAPFSHFKVFPAGAGFEKQLFDFSLSLGSVIVTVINVLYTLRLVEPSRGLRCVENLVKLVCLDHVEGLELSVISARCPRWLLGSNDGINVSKAVNDFREVLLVLTKGYPGINVSSYLLFDRLGAGKFRELLKLEYGDVPGIYYLPSKVLPVGRLEEPLLVGFFGVLDSCGTEVRGVVEDLCWLCSELLLSFVLAHRRYDLQPLFVFGAKPSHDEGNAAVVLLLEDL